MKEKVLNVRRSAAPGSRSRRSLSKKQIEMWVKGPDGPILFIVDGDIALGDYCRWQMSPAGPVIEKVSKDEPDAWLFLTMFDIKFEKKTSGMKVEDGEYLEGL